MKTYVLTISKVFPAYHIKKGEPTNFKDAFKAGQVFNRGAECLYHNPKLHTIRGNYELWAKRFEQIERGEAQLSIRQWSGKPYHSKQELICNLTKADGIGIQKLSFDKDRDGCISYKFFNIDGIYADIQDVANNDGLSFNDWREWFKDYDLSQPMAIIHFTLFRY